MKALLFTRFGRIILLALALLFVLPIVWAPCPALVDFPEHVQRCFFLSQWFKGAPPSPFYAPDLHYVPNLAMELTVIPLSYLIGIEWAAKLFAVAVAILPCFGASFIQRQISGRWSLWSLAPAVLLYNHVFEFGFVNYMTGVGLALVGIAVHLKLTGAPLSKRLGTAIFFAVVVMTAHLGGFIVYSLSLLMIELASFEWSKLAQNTSRLILSLIPPVVVLIIGAVIMLSVGKAATTTVISYYGYEEKIGYLLHPLSDGTTTVGEAIQLIFDLVILALIFLRAVKLDRRLLVATVFWGSTVLWFPYTYGKNGVFVDMRMAIVFTLFLYAGSTLEFRAKWHRTLVIALLFVCTALCWGQHVYKDTRANEVYPLVKSDFKNLPSGSAVMVLNPFSSATMKEKGWYPPMLHAPALAMDENVFVSNFFGDEEEQPVIYRPAYRTLHYQRLKIFTSASEWLQEDGPEMFLRFATLPDGRRPLHMFLYLIGPGWEMDTNQIRVVDGHSDYSIYEVNPKLWNP